jgi:hypothetical protein
MFISTIDIKFISEFSQRYYFVPDISYVNIEDSSVEYRLLFKKKREAIVTV